MNNFIRRIRKKALLKELKTWTDLMREYIEQISELDELIKKHENELDKMEKARLNQLKKNYQDAYNNANREAEQIRKEMEAL
jgi:predicted  nucleic acid-binding Zn-ribbon protein